MTMTRTRAATSLPKPSTHVRIFFDALRTPQGNLVRRPYLLDRETGLLCLLPTAFIDGYCANKATNTQIAYLNALSFLNEWQLLQQKLDLNYVSIEARAISGKNPLKSFETAGLSEWCKVQICDLTRAVQLAAKVRMPSVASTVLKTTTKNFRIRVFINYIQWLLQFSDAPEAPKWSVQIRKKLSKHLSPEAAEMPVKALDDHEIRKINIAINQTASVSPTGVEARDALICKNPSERTQARRTAETQITGRME